MKLFGYDVAGLKTGGTKNFIKAGIFAFPKSSEELCLTFRLLRSLCRFLPCPPCSLPYFLPCSFRSLHHFPPCLLLPSWIFFLAFSCPKFLISCNVESDTDFGLTMFTCTGFSSTVSNASLLRHLGIKFRCCASSTLRL